MSFLQGIVLWLAIGAMLSTFVDIEKARGKTPLPPDGLEPVNRRIVDLVVRQL